MQPHQLNQVNPILCHREGELAYDAAMSRERRSRLPRRNVMRVQKPERRRIDDAIR